MVNQSNIFGFIKNSNLDKNLTKLDKIVKLQAFDISYFRGKSHFKVDETENYLVFQPVYRFLKKIGNSDDIPAQKYTCKKVENICIVYEINLQLFTWAATSFTLGNYLFGAIKVTKSANPNEYKYSGYDIGSRGRFPFDNGFCKNVIRFVADMSSSVHAITDE